jgi:signal transduction histidine kinase/ActR/RegA family two-component response regulator
MNPAMIKRIGRNAIGDTCHRVLHGLDHKCDGCVFGEVTNGKSIETVITSSLDGRTFRVTNMPVRNQNGTVSKMSIFRDITAFLTAVAEKDKAQDQLLQSQKMESIGALAGGIAHDFNNILFPIIGHTEMLMDDLSEENSAVQNSLKEIYAGALRARDLVQQILTFARQEQSELTLMKMQPIIKEALKLIRSTIPTTISINQRLQPTCGAISADPTQIHQIIMNLATNAYHAMEENGGELKISLNEVELGEHDRINHDLASGLYACLTVSDTGKGMNKDIMKNIFDPFFTTKERGKGTGMGLSVVHGIVKNMNGAIKVYSEPGNGTEFHVYLPIVKSNFETQEIQSKEPLQGGTEKVLLVDDEESIIVMEKQVLERLGYQVTSHTSSIEALEVFKADPKKFDIVISDVSMPKMSGDKLAVEMIKTRPGIPILLCTGYSKSMTDEKTKSLGIKGFIEKPIVIKDLARKIREVLDKAPVKIQQ